MGAFAEFERTLIKERQMEGIELAEKFSICLEALYKYLKLAFRIEIS